MKQFVKQTNTINFSKIESINYMGAKTKLLPFLFTHIPCNKNLTFFDGFCGSHRVGAAVQSYYKSVTAVDKQKYSFVLGKALLNDVNVDDKIISEINCLPPKCGFLSETYGGKLGTNSSSIQSDGKTRLFTKENAEKIQAIRDFISENNLSYEYLYYLMIAAAKVQSSPGHQNGYFKKFSPNSQNALTYKKIEAPPSHNKKFNKVLTGDIFDYISDYHDVFYFDPPYGTINHHVPVATRYSAFYHFWNTLVLNDEPEIFGKANRRVDSKANTDKFEVNKKETFLPLIKKLFDVANGKHIFISLSNQAVVSKEDVLDFCKDYKIVVYEKEYKTNVQGKMVTKEGKYSVKKPQLKEYLYYLKK